MFLATHIVLFYVETIQMKTLGWEYLYKQDSKESFFMRLDHKNILECIMFVASVFYSTTILMYPATRFMPNHSMVFEGNSKFGLQVDVILSGTFLVFMSMVKLLNLLKSYDAFGDFVYMVIKCIQSTLVFCIFLGSWVFIFSLLMMTIGCTFDFSDYPGLSLRTSTVLQVYRNSIGDIAAPHYELWYNAETDTYTKGIKGQIMVLVIWVVWFLNQFFCMIMLMNFLIAIISEEYSQINTYSTHFLYTRRKELNYDALIIYNYFK